MWNQKSKITKTYAPRYVSTLEEIQKAMLQMLPKVGNVYSQQAYYDVAMSIKQRVKQINDHDKAEADRRAKAVKSYSTGRVIQVD